MPNAFDELEAAPKKRNVFDELESPRRNVFDELEASSKTNVPTSFATPADIGLDPETIERLRAQERDAEGFRAMNAGNDQFITAVAKSFIPPAPRPLTEFERRAGVEEIPKLTQFLAGGQSALEKLPGQLANLLDTPNVVIPELLGIGDNIVTKTARENIRLRQAEADRISAADQDMYRGSALPQFGESLIKAGAELPFYIGPGLAARTPQAALRISSGVGGVMGGGQQLAQDIAEGRTTAEALPHAVASGLITALTTRAFGATGVESIFRREGISGIKNRLLTALKEAGVEGAEELTDQVQQDFLERFSRNPNKPIDATVQEALMAFGVGSLLGGGVSGVRQAAGAVNDLVSQRPRAEVESLSVTAPEIPALQFAREIPQMSADEFREKGSSFNKQNIELGLRATPENIEELKQLREQAMNRAREAAQRMATAQTDADLQSITTEMQMPQFYNEAIAIAETLANNNIRYDGKTVGKNRTVHNFTLMDGDQEGGSFTMSETDLMPDRIAKKAQDVRATFAESLSEPATAAELKRIEQEGASLSQGQPLTDETPYEIFDTQTGEVVFEGLYKNRSRIRQAAEQRNKNYGAYRYAPRVKPVIGQDASLSQSEAAPVHELSEPPSRQELESKVKELRQKHPGMLEIRIADDYHGLPDRAHQAAYRQGANPAGIKGFVDGKTVWLNRQMLDNVEDAIATIWHEQFGHFATDKKLGRRLTRFMSQVRESFRDTELMRDTESRYRNADDVRLGREFVARIAENPNSNPGAWKRLVAMVRQWLRDIGFVKTVTENDIQALLRGAIDSLAAQESGVEPSLSVKSTKSDLPISTPENIGETSEMPPSPGEKTKPSRGKWFAGKNPVETAAMMQERANAFQKGKSDQQIIEDLAGWMSGNPNINLDSEAANFVIKDMLAKIGKSINPKQSTPQTMEKWAQIDRLSEMARRVGEQSGRELVSRRLAFNDINWLMPLLSWRGLAQKTWRKQLGLDENASVVDAVKDAATGKTKLPKLEVNAKIADLGKKFEEGKITEGQLLDGIAKELGLPPLSGETATKLMELAKQAESKPEGILRNKILQQMVDEIQRTTPASPFDIIRDYWYNNALSGSRTLAAILTGSWIHGAIMATQEAADAALQGNFKAARYIPLAFILDTFEGIANAVDVIRTGDYTRRAEFAENIQRALGQKGKLDSLEGWWKHGNKLQKALALTTFVRRAVVGLDYIGAISTRGSGVIYNALLESPQQLDQALKRFDKEASAQAKKQAQAELGPKAKWVDVRARQLEILEQGINQEIKENAKTLGEIAALNAPPVGLGAVAYKALEYIPRAIQSNFRTSKEAAQFAGFVGRAATGLAFARAAINMAANASNWMPLVGGINWGRALVGKRIPQEHWARVFGLYDEKGEPLSDDRRRLIFASHAMGLALVASVYALTRLGDDDDEKLFDVQGTWKGLSAKERKAKIDAGLRPLSIQVGGKTIRYDNLPVASALAVVGNIRDKERKDGKRMTPDDAITRITDGWASGIFYIKDLTPIRGFVDALGYSSMNTDEGADAINRWASQFARSGAALIPFASAQREIDTFFDPSHYKPRRSIDYWVRSIPWVRRYGGVGPEYNMAGLPIENPLWPSTRFIPADLPDDPVVDALSSLVARGVFPKHPDPSPTWIKDGERRSASEFPKETYRFQTEVLKAWRREMLRDAELIKKFTADEYEDYYRRYLAPLTQQIKAEIQNEIDPNALDYRGRVRQDYLKP